MTDKSDQLSEIEKTAAMIIRAFNVSEIAQLIRLIGPKSTPGELSEADFENLMVALKPKGAGRGLSETSKEVARLVLVMGAKPAEAAAELNITTQQASQVMIRIRRLMKDMPTGLKKVEGMFPESIAEQLELISKDFMESMSAETRNDFDDLKVLIKPKKLTK